MNNSLYILLFMTAGLLPAAAQKQIPLYAGPVPNSRPHEDREEHKAHAQVDSLAFKVSNPTLTIFLPEKRKLTELPS